ncbi:DEDD exonuclease domain-containing protein [Cellulomonas cellasea]|uniref:DEDD exonuclease domain-containing protein n=1 Tax=Cellulomonas cellasea TaxID=43670 RepID=UPI0025A3ACCA|nr:DEDD exonuclease domain-containing protein [Cellulomonas cellasea]MDM8085461.1 DEDD exonuclease domain-containing protein [Cellulomonas cellasea]
MPPFPPTGPARADLALPHPGSPVQLALDELGVPLSEVTFVVVDLETTGSAPQGSAITEIGAVKVRGGEVLGEFQTLVNPGGPIPAFISVLTGITTAMVVEAPRIEEVLPSFLEFARGAVLVAHNAPFDIGFLKAAAAQTHHPWPSPQVVDTVRLARAVVTRDEAPNHKLGTLAALFHATVTPDHRALSDARATVDVLHALLGRLAPLGVTHLEDLATAADPVPSAVRRKRHLADGLPDAPGVYMFRGPGDEVLYVGTSTTSLRARVRTYFTASEKRRRMAEMVQIAHAVTPVVCATPLEARVRELRLIAEHSPRYNRRSRFPERMPWVRLTAEAYPRLTVVREVRPDAPQAAPASHIGPFASRAAAQAAVDALHEAFPIRQCSRRLPLAPASGASSCALAGMGRCGAPCVGGQAPADYAETVAAVSAAMLGDPEPVVRAHAARIAALVARERFEEAAGMRDQLTTFLRGASRAQRLEPLARCPELVAARPRDVGGWEVVLVRHGRLAGTTTTTRGADPWPAIHALSLTGEHVAPPVPPAPAAHPEEADLILGWLESPGVRLVRAEGGWACPVRGSQALLEEPATVAGLVADHIAGLAHQPGPLDDTAEAPGEAVGVGAADAA